MWLAAGSRDTTIQLRLATAAARLSGVYIRESSTPPLGMTVTSSSARVVPALVEPDIFRSIAALPGVSQPNDLRGRLHFAGGRADETGIRLNGHPLQNPFHLAELLSGFNIASLARADVLLHLIPAESADHLSGSIDLTTARPPARHAGEASASLIASSLTTQQPVLPFGMSGLGSVRVTYLDKLARKALSGRTLAETPLYGFVDGVLSLERQWQSGPRLQLTGFGTHDQVSYVNARGPGYRPYGWNEWMLGASLGGGSESTSWSMRASLDRGDARFGRDSGFLASRFHAASDHASMGVLVTSRRTGWEGRFGATIDHRRVAQGWIRPSEVLLGEAAPVEFEGNATRTTGALTGSSLFHPRPTWDAGVSARLWLTGSVPTLAPAVWLVASVRPAVSLETSVQRRLQYETDLGEPIEGIGRPPLFLLDAPREAWDFSIGTSWSPPRRPGQQLRAQLFFKRYGGQVRVATEERVSFGVVDTVPLLPFPQFRRERGRSYGATLSGTLQAGSVVILQGAYTYQRAFASEGGTLVPMVWDAPHQGSGLVFMRLSADWSLTIAAQARSGLVTTGIIARVLEPAPSGGSTVGQRFIPGAPNSLRLPPFYRVDVGARRRWDLGRVELDLVMQVVNALAHRNVTGYDWPQLFCNRDHRIGCDTHDGTIASSLPLIPSVGFELRW